MHIWFYYIVFVVNYSLFKFEFYFDIRLLKVFIIAWFTSTTPILRCLICQYLFSVICKADGIQFNIDLRQAAGGKPTFTGVIYVKNNFKTEACRMQMFQDSTESVVVFFAKYSECEFAIDPVRVCFNCFQNLNWFISKWRRSSILITKLNKLIKYFVFSWFFLDDLYYVIASGFCYRITDCTLRQSSSSRTWCWWRRKPGLIEWRASMRTGRKRQLDRHPSTLSEYFL